MKTITKIMAMVLLSCAMLFDLPAQAQAPGPDYPYPGDISPIYDTPFRTVDCGNLDDPDQKTFPIWYKVSGNIVGPQPHNKMHNPGNTSKTGSYVTAGSYVDVNFNVNKNIDNRYSLVSYTIKPAVDANGAPILDINGIPLFTRTIFDYQSNLYNDQLTSPPVQGNSNQQLVLVPTNCDWEVYWVKGCVVKTFMANGTQDLILGPTGNPYRTSGYQGGNAILGYTFGDAAPNTVCDVCPVVIPNGTTCVTPQLIEVIDIPNVITDPDDDEKELIFSVINNINTVDNACSPMITKNNQSALQYPEIGDILFLNIFPSHTKNNEPYAFRYNYELGPHIPGYVLPVPTIPAQPSPVTAQNYFGAFVFDQRNNHNVLDYDIYQSEIVRYKIPIDEWDRLNSYTGAAKPQICIELSPKHPEPHTSLEPIYCFELDFDCGPPCPALEEVCFAENCDYRIELLQVQGVADPITGSFVAYLPAFLVTNISGQNITSVTFSTTGTTATNVGYDDDGNAATNPPFLTFNNVDADPNLLTYSDPTPDWNQVGSIMGFFYQVDAASVATVNGTITLLPGATVTATITNASGHIFTYDFQIALDDPNATPQPCQIIPLPVELTSFTGAPVSEGVALKWNTASEKSNDHFDIERSLDGKNFEKIGEMKGKGSTSTASEYKFLDKTASKGLNYYRLKQVDFDGTHAYSQIIKVSTEKGALSFGVKLIPNPCSDQNCSVLLQGVDASKALVVEMKDLTGRTVFRQEVPADQTSFNLPKANLGKGVYILSAKNGQYFTHQKVIIQ